MEEVEKFVGKYVFVSSDNFDAYMKHVGVSLLTRTMANVQKPVLNITKNGNLIKMESVSVMKTFFIEFELDKEIDEVTGDGRKMKSTFRMENGKLIQEQKKISPNDKDSIFERYFDDEGNLIITMQSDNVIAKRVYKKET